MRPTKASLAPFPNCGLLHVEACVQSLVEIIHAFMLGISFGRSDKLFECITSFVYFIVDQANVAMAGQLYMKLLLCKDTQISFAAKSSIIRKVLIISILLL